MDNSSIENHLPLTEVAFEILLALIGGDRHGYAILQTVAVRTGGRVRLHAGTLYRALNRMLEYGWIEELTHDREATPHDERRRYYRISPLGHEVARAETRRLASQVAAAREHRLVTDSELTA